VPPASVAAAIAEREAELVAHEARITELTEPARHSTAVSPAWVRRQLEDLTGLLTGTPERTKAEFLRLGLKVVLNPIRNEQPHPFLRANVHVALPCLAGIRDRSATAVDRLLR
jgi:hypothetical protein